MAHAGDAPSSALVPYTRRPRFTHSRTSAGAALSAFEPCGVLGLPPPPPLATLVAACRDTPASAAAAAARATAAREAYRELAARFHPDAPVLAVCGSGGSGAGLPPWLPRDACFAAVAAAHALLSDAGATLEYALAEAGPGMASAVGEAAWLAARARRRRAEAEASSLREQATHALAAQVERTRASGDGLHVLLALYGDPHAVRAAAGQAAVSPSLRDDEWVPPRRGWGAGAPPPPTARRRGAAAPPATPAWPGPLVLDVTRLVAGHVDVVPAATPAATAAAFPPEAAAGGHRAAGGAATTGHTTVQLVLPPGPKCSTLEGFWDPTAAPPPQGAHTGGEGGRAGPAAAGAGSFPVLLVRYVFLGGLHEACVDDDAPLRCPLKRHAVAAAPPAPAAAAAAAAAAGSRASPLRPAAQPRAGTPAAPLGGAKRAKPRVAAPAGVENSATALLAAAVRARARPPMTTGRSRPAARAPSGGVSAAPAARSGDGSGGGSAVAGREGAVDAAQAGGGGVGVGGAQPEGVGRSTGAEADVSDGAALPPSVTTQRRGGGGSGGGGGGGGNVVSCANLRWSDASETPPSVLCGPANEHGKAHGGGSNEHGKAHGGGSNEHGKAHGGGSNEHGKAHGGGRGEGWGWGWIAAGVGGVAVGAGATAWLLMADRDRAAWRAAAERSAHAARLWAAVV